MSNDKSRHHKYPPSPGSSTARTNFSALLQKIDLFGILPALHRCVVRSFYPLNPFPIPTEECVTTQTSLLRHRDRIVSILNETVVNYVVYITMFGITAEVALPTITIVLPNLKTTESVTAIRRIADISNPFNVSVPVIRYATRGVKPAGRTHYYPRVPLGMSISNDKPPPSAGTLGAYCSVIGDSTSRFAVTAGHVISAIPNDNNTVVLAPASFPFTQARQTLQTSFDGKFYAKEETTSYRQNLNDIDNLDTSFADIVASSTKTSQSPPFEKKDWALLNVNTSRNADNRLGRLNDYAGQLYFKDGGDDLIMPTRETRYNDHVWKIGIRTGLTDGTVMAPVMLKWDPELTAQVTSNDPHNDNIPASHADGILGLTNPDGSFEMFGDVGDLWLLG